MTKIDIAKELYERNYKWLSRNEASDMVELLIETLKENLAEGKMGITQQKSKKFHRIF